MVLNGVPIREAMELMRHSDMRLTTKIYTDLGLLNESKNRVIDNLPKMSLDLNAILNDKPKAATGIHGMSLDGKTESFKAKKKLVKSEAKCLNLSGNIIEGHNNKNGIPGKIRTCDPLIRSQMLYPLSYRDIFY